MRDRDRQDRPARERRVTFEHFFERRPEEVEAVESLLVMGKPGRIAEIIFSRHERIAECTVAGCAHIERHWIGHGTVIPVGNLQGNVDLPAPGNPFGLID